MPIRYVAQQPRHSLKVPAGHGGYRRLARLRYWEADVVSLGVCRAQPFSTPGERSSVPRTRFGDSAVELEVLARPQYGRAVWGARLAFPFWAVAMISFVTAAATGDEGSGWFGLLVLACMPPLGYAVFNVLALRVFITGEQGYRTLPISAPTAEDLFWRTINHIWLEALFIVRRKR